MKVDAYLQIMSFEADLLLLCLFCQSHNFFFTTKFWLRLMILIQGFLFMFVLKNSKNSVHLDTLTNEFTGN